MDAFKLLTRSTKLRSNKSTASSSHHVPSQGPSDQPKTVAHPEPNLARFSDLEPLNCKKRKRVSARAVEDSRSGEPHKAIEAPFDSNETQLTTPEVPALPEDQCRAVLKSNKVKIVDFTELHRVNTRTTETETKSKSGNRPKTAVLDDGNRKAQKEACRIYPQPLTSFKQLRTVFMVNQSLVNNVVDQGFMVPTEVQLASLPLLLGPATTANRQVTARESLPNLLTVAATGSGKTLAFLIPLINELVHQHRNADLDASRRHVGALVLAPTKELVGQIVNEGRKLTQRTGVRITAMRKGMKLSTSDEAVRSDEDESSDEDEAHTANGASGKTVVKSDVLVTTPLLLLNAVSVDGVPDRFSLSSITSLILDEADVLLDPLFRDQTQALWNACTNPALHVSFWSATIGSNIEELVMSIMQKRQSDLGLFSSAPLLRCIVGLKDSALPTISHKLIYAATEPGKLLGLRQLLHPPPVVEGRRTTSSLRPPFLVFTQTIERAIALHSELLYDIPSEAGGSSRIAVLHSDLSDTKRSDVMARFRKGQIWVLITTDLLSRGIDFRGINGVVNYDIPTTSAAYVHRVGRTGRAGREGGAAVTYYTKDDIKYVKGIANVIAASQKLRGKVDDDGGIKPWLLSALPEISKKDKQKLKTRGVEVRRSIKEDEDEKTLKAKRKARISTKSGYERKLENNRKGAVRGSQRRMQDSDGEDNDEWGGIDG